MGVWDVGTGVGCGVDATQGCGMETTGRCGGMQHRAVVWKGRGDVVWYNRDCGKTLGVLGAWVTLEITPVRKAQDLAREHACCKWCICGNDEAIGIYGVGSRCM